MQGHRVKTASLALWLAFTALSYPECARGLQETRKADAEGQSRPTLLLDPSGPLEAVVDGRRIRIADEALGAWNLGNRIVAYSARDGAGGFENEGEALYLYDLTTSRRRKIMSEVFMIDNVEEVKTSAGRTALIVAMRDGGLGASHVAVVDPGRGEVFLRRLAEITARKGDIITIGIYRPEDVDKPYARRYQTERYDLKTLLKRRVISNRRR